MGEGVLNGWDGLEVMRIVCNVLFDFDDGSRGHELNTMVA